MVKTEKCFMWFKVSAEVQLTAINGFYCHCCMDQAYCCPF